VKEVQHSLFGDFGAEPEEGRLPKNRKGLSAREIMLVNWMRANGPVYSTQPPLGFKVKDLERLSMDGVLVASGAQVRTFKLAQQ
jgi:hypothetical protein